MIRNLSRSELIKHTESFQRRHEKPTVGYSDIICNKYNIFKCSTQCRVWPAPHHVTMFSCLTKAALNRRVCFHPCSEVSTLWLWTANYHRANGSRLSLLLVTWLYSSNMFFSLFLTAMTMEPQYWGNASEFPPQVKHLLLSHKSL